MFSVSVLWNDCDGESQSAEFEFDAKDSAIAFCKAFEKCAGFTAAHVCGDSAEFAGCSEIFYVAS